MSIANRQGRGCIKRDATLFKDEVFNALRKKMLKK
jgi:hypothetical protein